ncbi:hypothetical protein [Nitrosomonas sp. Nm166]|nr:hypothetical protein [Nitrosomonas sp. Nm166]
MRNLSAEMNIRHPVWRITLRASALREIDSPDGTENDCGVYGE